MAWNSFRSSERGEIKDDFAIQRVWLRYDDKVVEKWLIIREESAKKHSYALCNAPFEIAPSKLAWWKCQRYFIERAIEQINDKFFNRASSTESRLKTLDN
ncbi:MAG: hypothetical protein HQL06_10765 [Nitrospirae bacterium]|nr:hypothetical protein [Nitrospirota bacterium]